MSPQLEHSESTSGVEIVMSMPNGGSARVRQRSSLRALIGEALRPGVLQGMVVLFDQGLCSIANFLTGVLVARGCSKAEYGLYVLGFTLLMTASSVQASLAGTPFTVLSPRLKGKERSLYLGSTLIQHLAVSAVTSAGFIVAAGVVFATGRTDSLAGVLFALAIASVFVLLRDFMRYVLLAQLRVWASLLMGLAANAAIVGMLVWGYTGRWLNAPAAYLIMAGGSALPVLFLVLGARRQISFSTKKLREHLGQNWAFGKWLVACILPLFFAVQVYPWALAVSKGPSLTAMYGACMAIAGLINPLFMGVGRYLGPKTSHAICSGHVAVRNTVNKGIVALTAVVVLFVLCILVAGEWALTTLYGGEYAGAGCVLTICALAVSVSAVGTAIDAGINAVGRPDITFKSRACGAAASLTVGVACVYSLGLVGAAIGLLVARIASFVYSTVGFRSAIYTSNEST